MRTIILSAIVGLGIGLAGVPAANAAPMSGLSSAAIVDSLIVQDAQYYRRDRRWRRPNCRSVQVCRRGPYGRRCHIERICRR